MWKKANLLRRASAAASSDSMACWWTRNTPFTLHGCGYFDSCGHPLPLDLFNQCLGSGYTHWNPGDHLEKLTGRTFDWDEINALRQKEIVRDLEHAGLLPGAGELIRSLAEKGISRLWPPAPLIAGWTAG